ncbi:hypothetical protein ACVH9Z_34345 [Rhodococcus opacus]|uniref:hypothetical protein n=1 Tax=Rhodococcus opacus TaxID=37919 RepID=UPI001B317DB3|nr:hypothetical protein [Rhodococcus opacus]
MLDWVSWDNVKNVGAVVSFVTAWIVVNNEIRRRRAFHRVYWHIEQRGAVTGQDASNGTSHQLQEFTLTNIGSDAATGTAYLVFGINYVNGYDIQPKPYLAPGDSAKIVTWSGDLDQAWAFVTWTDVADHRWTYYEWLPLMQRSPLQDELMRQMGQRWGRKRYLDRLPWTKGASVGPGEGCVPLTRTPARPGRWREVKRETAWRRAMTYPKPDEVQTTEIV